MRGAGAHWRFYTVSTGLSYLAFMYSTRAVIMHSDSCDSQALFPSTAFPSCSASSNFAKTCRDCAARPHGMASNRSMKSARLVYTVTADDDPRKGKTICPP